MLNIDIRPSNNNLNTPSHIALNSIVEQLYNKPYHYNYLSLLRQLTASGAFGKVTLGKSSSPKQEKIRLAQEPSLKFATRSIESVYSKNGLTYININGYGLLGVNAPLPTHLTEYVFERKHQYGDTTWIAFVNMLQHRLMTLFYRAWDEAQSINSLDKNREDKFSRFLASFVGLSHVTLNTEYEKVNYYSKLYFLGYYIKNNYSAAGLESLLRQYFGISIIIKQNMTQWIQVDDNEKTQLGSKSQYNLGDGLILGDKIFDIQNKFRLVIGPINLETYQLFFKEKMNAIRLTEWLHLYLGQEYLWDTQLILEQSEVPSLKLDNSIQLGLTSWLGHVSVDADDLVINYHLQ